MRKSERNDSAEDNFAEGRERERERKRRGTDGADRGEGRPGEEKEIEF